MQTISISVDTLVDEIGAVFLMESASSNPIPPKGILQQYMNEANARLLILLGKYVAPISESDASNELRVSSSYDYEIIMSPRKVANKLQPLADLMNAYLRNDALAALYADAQLPELSKKHTDQATANAQSIDILIHTKIPPMI